MTIVDTSNISKEVIISIEEFLEDLEIQGLSAQMQFLKISREVIPNSVLMQNLPLSYDHLNSILSVYDKDYERVLRSTNRALESEIKEHIKFLDSMMPRYGPDTLAQFSTAKSTALLALSNLSKRV